MNYSYRLGHLGDPTEIYIDGSGSTSLGTTYRNGASDWSTYAGLADSLGYFNSYTTDYQSGASWSFRPAATGVNQVFTWSGSYGFDYTISDGNGGTVTGTAHVAISGLPSLGRPNPPNTLVYPGSTDYVPVAVDLDGDGLEFSFASFDWNSDGVLDSGPWVHGDDGFLSIELDGQAQVSANELTFADHHPDAHTDMDGIRLVYDSNGNGELDVGDARYADFRIWQDTNQDGVTDEGELQSLAQAGIVSIGLTGPLLGETLLDGQITVQRETSYTTHDGSEGLAGDISLLVQLGARQAAQADGGQPESHSLTHQLADAANDEEALDAIQGTAALAVQQATAAIAKIQADNDAQASSPSLPPDAFAHTAFVAEEESAWT